MSKRMHFLYIVIIALLWAGPARAEPLNADLHIRSVDIDHSFSGMELLLYGARNDIGRLVVVLRGPERDYTVWKKERVWGVWVNRKSVEFDAVPSLYHVAATNPFEDYKNDRLLERLEIGIENIDIPAKAYQSLGITEVDEEEFRKALVEHKFETGLYDPQVGLVPFMGETLFRAWLSFPKKIVRGLYTAEINLINEGQLKALQTIPIKVSKVGFEAHLFDIAHNRSELYGLLCVVLALSVGWAGNRIFAKL